MAKTTKTGNRVLDRPQWYWHDMSTGVSSSGKITRITTSFTSKDQTGLLIHSIAIRLSDPGYISSMAPGDEIRWGITQLYGAGTVPVAVTSNGVLYEDCLGRYDFATVPAPETAGLYNAYVRERFNEPILVHPAALFLYVKGHVAGFNCFLGLYFEYVDISAEEYKEFFQALTSNAV